MVKYLFVIFYLCVVMFLKLGHQLANGETCCAGRHRNARYKQEVATKLISPMTFTVYCFCREMRSPGGSCFPLCNLLKNSVTSGVILKVNMSLFGCKLFSICVNRSQKCRNVHSQGVYLIMS